MLKCFCEEPMVIDPNSDNWYATSCGHMFHYLCLTNWLERSKTCPQCREPVRSGQMFRLFPTEWDDQPKDEINEALQTCLDDAQAQLGNMTSLCKKKDRVIANLKVDADNEKNFRRENEALKNLLQICDGDKLDEIFDDPNNFDAMLKAMTMSTTHESEEEAVAQLNTEASVTDGAEAQRRTGAGHAGDSDSESGEEAMESSLNTVRDMISRISDISVI